MTEASLCLVQFYASQTKMLEHETDDRVCRFEVLCEGVSTLFGLRMPKSLVHSFWPREYKTRPTESNRSMREDACCDFMAKRIQNPISHIDWNRIGRCARMHVVIFWPREYETGYRTSTESIQSMCDDACCNFSGQENTKPDIAHRLVNRWANPTMLESLRFATINSISCRPC